MRRTLTKLLSEDHPLIEKRSCKRRGNSERPKYQNVRVSFSSAGLSFDSVLAVGRAANWRSGWGVLSLITSFYGNGGTKFPDEVPAEQGSHAPKDGTRPARSASLTSNVADLTTNGFTNTASRRLATARSIRISCATPYSAVRWSTGFWCAAMLRKSLNFAPDDCANSLARRQTETTTEAVRSEGVAA